MRKTVNAEKQVRLPEEVLVKAEARAHALGLTLAEYVQSLVDKDAAGQEHDPWLEPIPKDVDAEWEKDIAAFNEQEKTNPRPRARTANELRTLLKQEAELLPDDEGH